MEPISVTEYRRQFGSIVHMYQACMHVGKRSALVRSKYIIFDRELANAIQGITTSLFSATKFVTFAQFEAYYVMLDKN